VVNDLREQAVMLWHKDTDLQGSDVVILPGGFSYGDYLRAGAIARFSPIMQQVAAHAARGGVVIGICNGFQIACEAHLLPGALLRNDVGVSCHPRDHPGRADRFNRSPAAAAREGQCLTMPIAHGEGRFTASDEELEPPRRRRPGPVPVRRCRRRPDTRVESQRFDAQHRSASCNVARNVVGLMPHPERAMEPLLGSIDGPRDFRIAPLHCQRIALMSTAEKPSHNEDEYFLKHDADLVKQLRAKRDAERHAAERKSHFMKCPKCGATLQEAKTHHVTVDICAECGGMWLDSGETRLVTEGE